MWRDRGRGRDYDNNPEETDCGLDQDGNTEWGRGSGWVFAMFWRVSDGCEKKKVVKNDSQVLAWVTSRTELSSMEIGGLTSRVWEIKYLS